MKKFIALCLLVAMLTGCSSVPVLSGSVNGPSSYESTALIVNGQEISASEIYVYLYLIQTAAGAVEERQLLDSVQEQVLEIEILSQRARDHQLSLGDDEKKTVDAMADNTFNAMGDVAEKYGITQTMVRDIYEKSQLAGDYYKEIVDSYGIAVTDEELSEYHAMTIQQLFIAADDTSHLEDGQTAEQLAASIKMRAEAGEDFKTLAKYFSSDNSCWTMDLDNEGCMLDSDGQLDSDFTTTVWKLKVGDISEIIHTAYGYHVVRCMDVDSDSLKAKLSEHILEQKQRGKFEKDYEIWQQETSYTKESAWRKLHIIE